jgi:hypothetical protein
VAGFFVDSRWSIHGGQYVIMVVDHGALWLIFHSRERYLLFYCCVPYGLCGAETVDLAIGEFEASAPSPFLGEPRWFKRKKMLWLGPISA